MIASFIHGPPTRTRLAWVAWAVVAAGGMLVSPQRGIAQDTQKANNTVSLLTGSSWVSNAVPSSTSVLVWSSTVTGANSVAIGGSGTFAGIRIANPGGAVTITNAAGNVLGLGASGIDMSAATRDLSILTTNVASDLRVTADQDWNVAAARTLTLFSNVSTVNTRLTGSANITVKGSGTVSMRVSDPGGAAFNPANGNGTYSGNWTISGGSKVISQRNGTQAFGSGTITLDNGIISQQNGGWNFSNNIVLGSGSGTITNDSGSVAAGRYMNLPGVISGAGGLIITNNSGAWGEGVILTGSNTFTGPVTINSNGVLRIGGDATTTTNSVNTGTLGSIPSSVAITNNGVLGFGWSVDSTFANAIAGTGIVRLGRTSYTLPNIVLSLTGTSTYTGATQVNSGTIEIGGAGQLGNGSYAGNISIVANSAFRVATSQSQTLSGTISGAGVLVKSGAGTLTVSTSNSYSGGTTLNAGILSFGTNALGTTGNVTLNGGTFQWASGNSQDLSARLVFVSGSTATLDTNGNAVTFASGIGGSTSAALVKAGAGTLVLSTTSTYTGPTTIDGGTLQFGVPAALYGGTAANWTAANITTGSGAALALSVGASNFTAGDVTTLLTNLGGLGGAVNNNGLEAGSAIAFDTSTAGGSFTVADSIADSTGVGGGAIALTKLGSGTLTLSGNNSYTGFTTISGGVLSLTGNQSLGSNLAGSSSTLQFGANTVTIGTSVAGDSNGVFSGTLDGTGAILLRGGGNTIMNADGTSGTSGNAFAINASAVTIPPSAFALDTGASASDRKDFGFRNDTSATLNLASLSGFGAIRGDGAGDGTPRLVTVNQTADTTFSGAIVSHVSTGSVARPITFEKQGSGTLTLAGFIGRQTVSAATGTGAPVNLIANGGLLLVTNTFNTTTTNTAAINASGTVTITSGTLGFAPQALVNTAGTQGVAAIRMNGGVLRWHGTNTQDITAGGRLTLVAGQTATFDTNGNDVTLGTALGGGAITGAVTKIGAGTLVVNASNTYTGTTTVSSGTLQLGNGGAGGGLSDSSAINIGETATFRWNRSSTDTGFGNNLLGSGTFLKSGAVELGLTGSNTFSGLHSVQAGKLALQGANSAVGSPVVSLGASGTLSLGSGFASGTATISGLSGAGVVDAAFTAGTDTRTLRINQPTDAVYSGTFNTSGTRVLRVVKGGAGTLTLSGAANAYAAGDLVVDSGTLQIGSTETSVAYFNSTARTVTVNAGDTLVLNYRNAFGAVGSTPTTKVVINGGTVTSSTGATGSVNVLQDLTLNDGATLQAANGFGGTQFQSFQLTGTTTVGGSIASSITTLSGASGITVGNGTNNTGTTGFNVADVTGNAAADLTISAAIANSGNTGANVGALAKSGAGRLLLTGSNTYTGETSITAGTLEVGGSGRLGGGSYAANIANAGSLLFSTSANQTLSGTINGVGTLAKSGAGTLTLSGSNTYTGATTITGGTLSVSSDGNLGAAPGVATAGQLVIDGGVLSASAGFTLATNRGLGLGPTSGDGAGTIHVATGTLAYGGVAANNGTGSDGLVKTGAGRLLFTGVNTYTGSTAITAGAFEVGGAGQLGAGTYAGAIANDGTLRFSSSADQTLSGGITGVGGLEKAGTGVLTLLGNNTYAGATAVTGGGLAVGGIVSSSPVTVSGGAILSGTGTLADVTLTGGVLSPGNSPGNLTVGSMSWDETSSYTWQMYDYAGVEGAGWDIVTGTGALTVTGTGFAFNLVSLSSITPDTVGPAFNWSQTTSGTFRLATFAGGITTPGGTWWTVNTGIFSPFSTLTGTFSVSTVANDMFLVYTYLPPPAYVWTGGDGSWSGGSNWDTTTAPEGTVDLIYSGTGGVSTNDLTSGTGAGQLATVTSLTFSGSAGPYTIGGNGFTLGSGGVVNQSAATQTVQNDLTLGAVSLVDAQAADLVLSGSILTAGNDLSVTGSSHTTLSGVVAGAGGLVKQGTGMLRLTGDNDYTGGTTITSGSLVVGDGATSGVLPGNVTTNAALAFDRSDDVTFAGEIGGIGSVTKLNTNTLTLTGSNTYTGLTTISGGTLRIGAGGTTGSITGDVVNGSALVFDRSDSLTYAGAVGGVGSLTQSGSGTLSLIGSSTYTGATLVNAGVLQIGSGGTTGAISASSAVTIAAGGMLAFNRSNAFDFGSSIAGVGTLLKLGTADTALTGSNSFSGLVDIQDGRLAFDAVNAAAGSPSVNVASGATLSIGAAYDGGTATIGGLTGSGTVDTNYGGAGSTRTLQIAQATSGTFSGVLQDASGVRVLALAKSGAGTLSLSGVSTYTGTTSVTAGTLQLLGSGSLSSSTVLAIADAAGATFDLNGRTQTVAGLTGGGVTGGSVLLGSGTLEVSRASGNDTFAGVVSGVGRLVKSGAGTLELTGSNSYSGGTTLSAGTLALGNAAALGSGTMTVTGSSTLQAATALTGVSAVGNAILLTSNLTVAGSNDLQLSGTLTQQGADRLLTNNLPGGATLTLGNVVLSGNDTSERRLTFAGSGNTLASGVIASGTGAVGGVIIAGGTVTFTAANTYTGVTFLEGGLLSIADVAALGSGTGNAGRINFTGIGTLRYTSATSGTIANKQVWSDLTTPIASTSTIEISDPAGSLTITPTGGTRSRPFTKTGPGSLTMNGAFTTNATVTANGGTLVLNGANSYTGQTTINTGTLVVGNASALGSTAPLAVNGGTLDLAGFSNTVGVLTGSSGATITANGSGTSTLTVNSASFGTFAGQIADGTAAVALTKSGAGALTLTASNAYTGRTTLSAGTLRVGDDAAIGSGPLALNGGTLSSDGATPRTFANAVAVGGNVTLGDATSNGLLTFNGNFDFGGATRQITAASDVVWSGTVTAGAGGLTKLGAGTLTLSGTSSYTGGTTVRSGTLVFTTNNFLGSGLFSTAGDTSVTSFGSNRITIGTGDGNATYNSTLAGTGTVALRGGSLTIVAPDGNTGATGNSQFFVSAVPLSATAFGLDTGASTTDRKDFGFVNDNGTPLVLSSLTGLGAIRMDSGGTGGQTTMRFITVNQEIDTQFDGSIVTHRSSGNANRALTFEKQGAGTLTLAGFLGKQTASANSGAVPLNIVANGGGLIITNSNNTQTTNTGAINTSGTVTITSGTLGFANLALINAAGSTGVASIRMNGGVLQWYGTNTQDITAGGRLTLVSGSTATFDTNGNDVTLATAFGGGAITSPVTKIGAGTLTLTAANTYTGVTTVSAGTLALGDGGANGSIAGDLVTDASVVFNRSGAVSYAGAISGNGSIIKQSSNALTLTNANSFSGGSTIQAGSVLLGNDAALGSGTVTLAGGALSSDGATARTLANALVVNADTTLGNATNNGLLTFNGGVDLVNATRQITTPSNVTIAGAVTNGGLTKAGAGTMTLSAANGYAGATTISGGTLALSSGGSIQSSSGVNLSASGATLDISNASGNRTIGSLSGTTGSQILLGGNGLTAGDATSTTFSGVISGSGGFTKVGAGTLSLTSAQAFTGDVIVSAGELEIGNAGDLSSVLDRIFVDESASLLAGNGLTVASGQTLGGFGTVDAGFGVLTFNSGAYLSPGGSVGQLDGIGDATFNGGMTYVFEINNATGTPGIDPGWDLFATNGELTLAASIGSPINLDILSLAGSGTGQAANFDPNFNYAWKFVVAGVPISSFNSTLFNVDATGFANSTSGGQFYVARGDQLGGIGGSGTNQELFVVFAAVPEPSTVVLAGIGLAVAGLAARRRRQSRGRTDSKG